MKYIITFVACFAILSCGSKKQTKETKSQNSASTAATASSNNQSIKRFVVSFISTGGGIDREARASFDQFIGSFNDKNQVKLQYQVTPWGREGEVDYCFGLNELNADQQVKFINDTKSLLSSSTKVRYRENAACN